MCMCPALSKYARTYGPHGLHELLVHKAGIAYKRPTDIRTYGLEASIAAYREEMGDGVAVRGVDVEFLPKDEGRINVQAPAHAQANACASPAVAQA